jgi:hypothetical protein
MNNLYYFLLLFFIISPLFNRVGWRLSKNILYFSPTFISVSLTLVWGFLVFIIFNGVTNYFKPNFYFGLIYSLANGMYCANPAFGLFNENTLTADVLMKHKLINSVGIIIFIVLTLSNAYLHFM